MTRLNLTYYIKYNNAGKQNFIKAELEKRRKEQKLETSQKLILIFEFLKTPLLYLSGKDIGWRKLA